MFLGLCNYYRKFHQLFSDVTVPLSTLLKKNTPWKRTYTQQIAFEKTKDLFLQNVVLQFPDFTKPFYIQADSSGYAIGAELYQEDENKEHQPIAFISRSLRGAELNYTVTEKELLSIINALSKFRTIVLGNTIIIRTDHKALEFLYKCRFHNERITRWILFLNGFDYSIQHVKGKENIVADALSRFPSDNNIVSDTSQPLVALFQLNTISEIVNFEPTTEQSTSLKKVLENFAEEQKADSTLSQIRNHLISHEPLSDKKLKRNIIRYSIHNNILLYSDGLEGNKYKLAIPEKLIPDFCWYYHNTLGHFGSYKIITILKRSFLYWPNMIKHLKQILRSCDLCQKTKYSNIKLEGNMHPIISTKPGELVCIDFYGPLPPGIRGVSYIFVVIDNFSKYVKLYALRSATSKAAATKLIDDYHKLIPISTVLSDHGSQFTSSLWSQKLTDAGIRYTFSSIRHPASNPSERVMRELGRIFRAYCSTNNSSWATYLPRVEELFNKLPHSSTGFSPHEIIFNNKPTLPYDHLMYKYLPHSTVPTNRSITELHNTVRNNLKKNAIMRTKTPSKVYELNINDLVLLRVPAVSKTSIKKYAKFQFLFDGPYKITAKPYPNVYTLSYLNKDSVKGNYNINNLKLYNQFVSHV